MMPRHTLMCLIFSMLSSYLTGCDFHDFDIFQRTLTEQAVELKIKSYLEKEGEVNQYYKLTPRALYIGDLKNDQIDYILYLAENLAPPHTPTTSNGLKNKKIAIDPGHFGGSYAELEERYVHIPSAQTRNKKSIHLQEGDLTFATALELKHLLEEQGAIVLLTRSEIGKGAIKESFSQWLALHPELKKSNQPLSKIFREQYNSEDLKERANKINTFSPDITLVIHYNSHLSEEEKKQKSLLTQSNYNLVFVPGAFCAKELTQAADRYEFLRLLTTPHFDESLRLSECIIKHLVNHLNVPAIGNSEKTSYIESACMAQKPGIYSRNLALTRLIHSPLCYGETLIQNNREEIYRLSEINTSVAGMPCPSRVKEVAFAYFLGIKEYLSNQEDKKNCKKINLAT